MATQYPNTTLVYPEPRASNCPTFQQPIVAVGKEGSAPGEFCRPEGVAVDSETGHIYIADNHNNRIQIFSETGQYIHHFGENSFQPCGILVYNNSVYVTDWMNQAVSQFRLPEMKLIKRVGHLGAGREEFTLPRQLAISPNEQLYIADDFNNRLQILSTDLIFKDTLQHQTMNHPSDVKFSKSEIFVLSWSDNPCIHVFTLLGEKSRSLVTRRNEMQVKSADFFCLDKRCNIFIHDRSEHDINVFSQEGEFLHTIRRRVIGGGSSKVIALNKRIRRAKYDLRSSGIALDNNKLYCAFAYIKFGLQIFSVKCLLLESFQ